MLESNSIRISSSIPEQQTPTIPAVESLIGDHAKQSDECFELKLSVSMCLRAILLPTQPMISARI